MKEESRPTLYLVDGSGYLFRAYHAIAYLSNSQGVPTNAVFGVTRMLLKLLDDARPTHLAVVMDPPGKNFRHEIYPAYKANRPPAPEDLKVQFPLVHRAIEALALPLVMREGYEADDVIATLAERARAQGFDVVVVSADKDLMQLVGDGVEMWDPMRDAHYDPPAVREKWGVGPEQVADLLALMGDSSDNIPGVSGVGPKTAAKLLAEHGDLDSVLAAAAGMKKSKLRERLIEQVDQARLSRRLVELCRQVELGAALDDLAGLRLGVPDSERLDAFLEEMEFAGLRRELVPRKSIDTAGYRTIRDLDALRALLDEIRRSRKLALDLETTSLDSMQAEIVGISLCPGEGRAAYVPVAHTGQDAGAQLPVEQVLALLAPLLADPEVRVYGQNIKYDATVLAHRHGLRITRVACDAMLASYVLDPGRQSHGMDALARDLLGHETITYEQVTGRGKEQIPFAEVAVDRATEYSGEDADITFRLCEVLLPRVAQAGFDELLHDLELPLIQVLLDMELTGVLVDQEVLAELRREAVAAMEQSAERIQTLAGHEFNLNSPAQLRVVLFEELGLPVTKKTKSGPSTDQTVLEELAGMHELPSEILAFRSLAKLKSTYLDVLPDMIHPETGRIHTSYNQAVAATGRLSSSNPNLQNIPIRTDMGRRIRQAFVAPPGCVLLSADYSQVELRILAHLCQDEALLEAFAAHEDIHARTAARVFDVPVEQVTSQMRARAKAVNFGIVYGQGPFNLARQLQIPQAEAKQIIDSYLARHRRVGEWVERTHAQARVDKFVTTLFGRRRYLPDIDAQNHNARRNAERMAQNTPIQGTAADIIKRAMIEIHRDLARRGLGAKMLMQVHDELVFEVPEADLSLLSELVREKMEGAAELAVPLTVDISTGRSWAEAH
jgi:DNA polymerase-1